MISAASSPKIDALFLGETHYDAVAHKLQEIIFARVAASRPSVALSLEMFEMDVQQVVDEYLHGHIREEDFVKDGRPWPNYKQDYKPMVELAKAAGLPVVAANAPRRYVSAVGRNGKDALTSTSWGARAYADLPPLPLPEPSSAYMEHLMADPEVVPKVMAKGEAPKKPAGGCPHIGVRSEDGLVAPMLMWDASMAYSIAEALQRAPSTLVVHVCGSDHCKLSGGSRVGAVEMLRHYAPTARPLVVVMVPEPDCQTFVPARHGGLADFVQAALYAAGGALLTSATTYSAIRLAEHSRLSFPESFLRRGRFSLPMGVGLVSACVGAKLGVGEAVKVLDAAASERMAAAASASCAR